MVKNFGLQKKMVLQILVICMFLGGVTVFSSYNQKKVADQFRRISFDQLPKVEMASKMIAHFRLIRIKVRSLGVVGNSDQEQIKFQNETKKAVQNFVAAYDEFKAMSFSEDEQQYLTKMDAGWNEFLAFGLDLLSKYENPTEESLAQGAYMIRDVCPIKAAKWMSVAQEFLKYQSDKAKRDVAAAASLEEKIQAQVYIGIALSVGLAIVFGFLFSARISNSIQSIAKKVTDNSKALSATSHEVSQGSEKLDQSTQKAASSLQQTVTAIDEISSMVQRNAEAAEQSTELSMQSIQSASRGKGSVDEMMSSIQEISRGNDQMAVDLQKTNDDIAKILGVVAEIGEKTKIINDIVFQTKLLSFNASVEAARAGSHGRGFSVVAEEIGNLAALSGTAAHEISTMLEKSISEVKNVTEASRRRVDQMVADGQAKVSVGTKTAEACRAVLDEILNNVEKVNETIAHIASASKEQSIGVHEVSKALQELDHVTH